MYIHFVGLTFGALDVDQAGQEGGLVLAIGLRGWGKRDERFCICGSCHGGGRRRIVHAYLACHR